MGEVQAKPAIICVDDELILLESLRDELRQSFNQKFLIEIVDSGEGALELVEELLEEDYEIPLVISDYIMPGMKGDELLKRIHQRLPKTLKVMLTGQATIEAVGNAIQHAKLYRYIAKPWQPEDLRLTVSEAVNSYQQDKKLAAQNQQLLSLNQALEEANRTLEQRVDERTQALSTALDSLKAAQESLVQSEKMAALGQLVAGVAHEINTPMGAIRASIGSLITASARSLEQLPNLLRSLSEDQLADFQALLALTLEQRPMLVAREERQARRTIAADLAAAGVPDSETVALRLVSMGITQGITRFIPLLSHTLSPEILAAAQALTVQRNSGERIRLAVEKATKIVSALKSYARQSNDSEPLRTNLQDNIDMVLTLYHNNLKRGVEVVKQYESVPEIWGYPDELNQVWSNLIHNGIQAMNGQGTLTITLKLEGEAVHVSFSDTGSGIPENIQARIFDPFFTTKPVGEGSGMGLSIVHRIVDRHRGTITVASQPGATTFHVLLPLQPPPSKSS
ncbi:ATP-binding protein [Leptolyngbya sp. PCC 6406]|uniref:hybrid sensor histidine kinase/response regulator n=1 Tax=Leptolyngbya sp. PCC 6406 TaxID=1173264 RepID=UPI0002AB9CBB|nr:ATP-binding protein [Leptolyngbya sp. PCC 6406]